MSVILFEQITENLTDQELKQAKNMEDIIRYVMSPKIFGDAPKYYKAPELVEKINFELAGHYRITAISLRKWCNYMRSTGTLPILASSQGYILSTDKQMIRDQIRSLNERANSILSAAKGLEIFLR